MPKPLDNGDDFFGGGTPAKSAGGDHGEDFFGPFSGVSASRTPEQKAAGAKAVNDGVGAFMGGVGRGLSLGYADRAYAPSALENMRKNPGTTLAGTLAGGILPGMAAAAGGEAVAGPGMLADALGAGTEGALSDPGKDGSRTARGLGAALTAVPLGAGARFVGKQMGMADAYDNLYKAGYADKVNDQVKGALGKLNQNYIVPRAGKVAQALEGTELEVNPEHLKGWAQPDHIAADGSQIDPWGAMAESMERGGDEAPMLSGNEANNLKKFLDEQAGRAAGRPFSDVAKDGEERATSLSNYYRNKLAEMKPEIREPNDQMSDAIKLRSDIRTRSDSSPLNTVAADPTSDAGQKLLKFDQMAGTNLSGLGTNIRDARKLKGGLESALSLDGVHQIYRYGKLYVGKTGNGAQGLADWAGGKIGLPDGTLSPLPGTKENLISTILENMKNQSSR